LILGPSNTTLNKNAIIDMAKFSEIANSSVKFIYSLPLYKRSPYKGRILLSDILSLSSSLRAPLGSALITMLY